MTSNNTDDKIKETFALLQRGNEEITFNTSYKDVILLLGITGAGKSTMAQILARNNENLISKEIGETGNFKIIDANDKISNNSTLTSKTVFPELIVDPKANTAFYDLPGFSDTRSLANDISASYFIKKVIDSANSVKLVFLVSYNSVKENGDRIDFMSLLKHACTTVKEIEKFKNSIALVATKVDNTYTKKGKLVSDENIIRSVANFLENAVRHVEAKMRNIRTSLDDQQIYQNEIKLVNILLTRVGETYPRIGIFRQPDEAGVVSNITLLQDNKRSLLKLINENIKFTKHNANDFGYTISEDSKNLLHNLIAEIYNNISFNVEQLVGKVLEYYKQLIQKMQNHKNYLVDSKSIFDLHFSEIQNHFSIFRNKSDVTSKLIAEISNISAPDRIVEKLDAIIVPVNMSRENVLNISVQVQYLNFLQTVSNGKLNINPSIWTSPFYTVEKYLTESNAFIRNSLIDTGNNFERKLKSDICDLDREIKNHFSFKEIFYEIENSQKIVDLANATISRIRNTWNNTETHVVHIGKTGVGMPEIEGQTFPNVVHVFSNAVKYDKYSKFLQNVNISNTSYPFKCDALLKDIIDYLESLKNWYNFLNNLYNALSDYKIQKDTEECNALSNKIPVINDKEGKLASEISLEPFLRVCYPKAYPTEYNYIKSIKLDTFKLAALQKILDLTLTRNVRSECSFDNTLKKTKLTITGPFIKLSDINESQCSIPPNVIEVFALNTVFIDRNFNKLGKAIQLSIISPTWVVLDNYKITLDGSPGQEIEPKKAKSGSGYGENGNDGQPGLPGGPGGYFLGIGETFINVERLEISANGGIGGPGQHGGDGANGKDGDDAKISFSPLAPLFFSSDELKHLILDAPQYAKHSDFQITDFYASSGWNARFKIHGKDGLKGGDAGNGGKGGNGGDSGIIEIIALQKNFNLRVNLRNKVGALGINGNGGTGGRGGNKGKSKEITYSVGLYDDDDDDKKSYSTRLFDRSAFGYPIITEKDLDIYWSPMNGKNGMNFNYNNMKQAPAATFANSAYIINDYKNYVIENLYSSIRASSLKNFLHLIDEDQKVQNLYNTPGFLNELYGLENQFQKLHNKIPFAPFYQSLSNRLDKYIKNYSFQNDQLVLLHYLRVASFSKIYATNDNIENYMVVDIDKYFTKLEKDIEQYKNSLREITINVYQDRYQNTILLQITEANNLIQLTIVPEINEYYAQIDYQIELLIRDILSQQKEAEANKENLIKKRQKLADQLLLRTFVNVLRIATVCLGPMAPIAAAVGNVGVAVIENVALKNTEPSLVGSTENLLQTIKDSYKSELEFLKTNLQLSMNQSPGNGANETDEEMKVIRNKISSLSQILGQSNPEANVYVDEKIRVKKELQQCQEELSTQLANLREKTGANEAKINILEKSLKAFGRIRNIFNVAESGFRQYKQNKEEIEVLGETIELINKQIVGLRSFEQNIYDTMIPLLDVIRNNWNQIRSNSSQTSHSGLVVNKWIIQNSVKNVQKQLREMLRAASNLDIQKELTEIFDQIQNAMLIVNQIYDRIQDNRDRSQLAQYIADLHSDPIRFVNEEFKNELNDLELMIKSNLIQQEYKSVVSAFQQCIFPFADLYFGRFDLPSHLRPKNFTDIVRNVAKEMYFLKDEIIKDATVIKPSNYHIYSNVRFANIDGRTKTIEQPAFFTWDYHTYREKISQLLLGKQVILAADIAKGFRQNAVQFREIGINFITKNETMKNELDRHLSEFLVEMTHLGNSYYRCEDKYYIITHSVVNMRHLVNRDDDGRYSHSDTVYDKIKNNPAIFSPYAIWKFKLISKNANENDFDALKKYQNQTIDLALEGRGKFVERGLDVCNDNLKKYYQKAEFIDDQYSVVSYQQNSRKKRRVEINLTEYGSSNPHNSPNSFKPVGNTASRINSPLNTVINWFHKGLVNMVNFEQVKTGIKSVFVKSDPIGNSPIRDDTENSINMEQFDVNNVLTLANFMVRYFTKSKPCDVYNDQVNMLQVKAQVLELITEFENILEDISFRTKVNLEFDPAPLMSKLEKEMINGNGDRIKEILYQSFTTYNESNLNELEMSKFIQNEIDKILEHKNSTKFEYFEQPITRNADDEHVAIMNSVHFSEKNSNIHRVNFYTRKLIN